MRVTSSGVEVDVHIDLTDDEVTVQKAYRGGRPLRVDRLTITGSRMGHAEDPSWYLRCSASGRYLLASGEPGVRRGSANYLAIEAVEPPAVRKPLLDAFAAAWESLVGSRFPFEEVDR